MKVDLTLTSLTQTESSQVRKPVTAADGELAGIDSSLGDDKVTLSLDNAGVNQLQAQAMSLPDVRSEKVQALREAIASGQYKIEPEKIAESMTQEFKLEK